MKYALLTAAVFALSGLALAQDLQIQHTDRLRQFQRDLPLIEVLVREGLKLSAESNPLKRAQTCSVLAEKLVREIKQAGVQREAQRAANLGNYLEVVLVRGVANNLDTARSRLPDDAADPDLERIRTEVLRATESVSSNAAQTSEQQIIQPAAAAIREGRAAVQKAGQGR